TPDGTRAVSASSDQTLKVWDLPSLDLVTAKVLSDRPLTREDIKGPDHLGYGTYVAALFQLISQRDTGLPLSIAISAPWGSGKSSIMSWLQYELDDHRRGRAHQCTVVPGVGEWNPRRLHWSLPGLLRWFPGRLTARSDAPHTDQQLGQLGLIRQCKTVWIDAWKYENSAALWAAFTKEIYQQAQRQLGGPLARLRFRLALANSVQVSPSGSGYSWWSVIKALGKNRWTGIAGLLSGGITGVGGYLAASEVGGQIQEVAPFLPPVVVGAVSGAAASVGGAITWAKGWVRQPFSFDLNGITAASQNQPKPVDPVNAPGDIARLIKLLAPAESEALVVFVDDLDRCSPDKLKDAVEAINLLFNGSPDTRSVFVLGMDVDMVAASMQVAYAHMVEELGKRDTLAASEFGHRFLGKVVQLSFNLPEPEDTALDAFLNELVGSPGRVAPQITEATIRQPVSDERRQAVQQQAVTRMREVQSSEHRATVAESLVYELPEPERPALAEAIQESLQIENLRSYRRDSPEVQDAIVAGSRFLPPRPRDYKRFVNAVRLQLLVANQSIKLDQRNSRASNEEIAKWTALGMRWPVLAEEISKRPSILGELEQWAKDGSAGSIPWPHRVTELMSDHEFEKALAADPQLGNVGLYGLLSVR
ncbi:MAG: P-loop NTPase fold protein, partial [Dehalococcoidia bacterium]